MKLFWSLLLGFVLSVSVAHAQLVTIPIPGSPLSLNVMANPQPLQNINNNPAATSYQLWDDGWANVPLPFTFPFFDRTFNNSTMYSNGAVQFGPPVVGFPSNNTFCCNGITIDRNTPAAYNYSILMMQDDLYGSTGTNHYSLGTSNTMTYGWYNVERLGSPENKTSFELKIDSTGGIDMRWTGALLSYNSPAIGVIGDAAKGEFSILQQGGLSVNTFSIPGLTQWTTGQTPDIVIDPCTTNPLFAPSCAGYQAAYTEQQCSINPLYSTTCSGYQTAYTNQQCSINPMYSTTCSGYAAAYLEQQCTANPLYSTTCSGYAQAYFNQQCTLSGLYDRSCPNYSTAYATKMLLEQQGTASIVATAGVIARQAPSAVSVDGTVSSPAAVSATGDSTVDKAIAPPAPANTAAAPSAPVQLVQAAAPPASPPPPAKNDGEKKPEGGNEKQGGDKPSGGNQTAQNEQSNSKPAAPTARQEIQARREAAAKAAAVESGKNLANEMGKAADMEAQKAVQNVVIQAMGFTPGFDSYGKTVIPDTVGYKPFTVYNNQKNIDNRSTARIFGGTDRLHNDMVESQYQLGNFGK